MSERGRWPAWVYRDGEEPDYRFSFANERTFLAWIRTSLALLAAAVAVDVVDLNISTGTRRALAGILVALGLLAAVVAWLRWAAAERAIRRGAPLPSMGFALGITLGLVVAALVVVVATL
jgi:putative membrane protein